VVTPNVETIVAVFTPTFGDATVRSGGLVYPIPGVIVKIVDIPKVFTRALAVLMPTAGGENVSIGKFPEVYPVPVFVNSIFVTKTDEIETVAGPTGFPPPDSEIVGNGL
jgi:hypothetical protein